MAGKRTPREEPGRHGSGLDLSRRDLIRWAGASAGLAAAELSEMGAGAQNLPADPILTDKQVQAWFLPPTVRPGMGVVRPGNEVLPIINGPQTFRQMVSAIRTATGGTHFIYILGWHLNDNFDIDPTAARGTTTVQALLTAAAAGGVQVRAMLFGGAAAWYMGCRAPNSRTVDNINALPTGAAILDDRFLNLGSHHQKILIVNGTKGLIAFCGGIDINPDRLYARGVGPNAGGDTNGAPLHDVHCRLRGPAAGDLLNLFAQRWLDNPEHTDLDTSKGVLLCGAPPVAIPKAIAGKTNWLQIGRTYGNGWAHAGIATTGTWPNRSNAGYSFLATNAAGTTGSGEQSAGRMIIKAIRQAQKFIYVEDQYFVDTAPNAVGLDVRAALIATLRKPGFQFLIALVPHQKITSQTGGIKHKRLLIDALAAAAPGKVRVYTVPPGLDSNLNLIPPGRPFSYVHAKTWIFDDQFAIIGSCNCCRRSFTHDSEVVAGICDQGNGKFLWTPHVLRMTLWSIRLQKPFASMLDPIASASPTLWSASPVTQPYNRAFYPDDDDRGWNNTDPDGS